MTVRFGISGASPEQLLSLPAKLPKILNAVEFPGDMLESTAGYQKLTQFAKNGALLFGRDFISPEIASLIPEENCKLRSELENYFQKRCARAAELGVKDFSVSFDLFHAAADGDYREKLGRFLRRCAGVARDFKETLHLVCRIPGGGNFKDWAQLLKFRNDLLCPDIELLLELHPHEPGAAEKIAGALEAFRLYDSKRRVCYDAEIGNTVTAAALKCCTESRSKGLEPDMVLFFYSGNSKVDSARLSELQAVLNSSCPGEGERK